jgi:photosystem II stability/assembly factor-like uncharacterized protein
VVVAVVWPRDGQVSEPYVSSDDGETWAPLTGLPALLGALVAMDPWHPGTFYAAASDEPAILRSTDAGATWQPLPTIPIPNDRGRGFVFDSHAIYVNTWDEFASTYRYYRSSDGGATWTLVQPPLSYVFLAGGVEPGVLYASGPEGFCRSSDSASTWSCVSTRLPQYAYEIVELPGESSRLVALSYDGLYVSSNRGGTWVEVADARGYKGYVTSLAADASGSLVMAGTFGGVLQSLDRGDHWTNASAGLRATLIRSLAVDPRDPSTVLAATGFGMSSAPQLFRSTDDGFSWSPAGGPGASIGDRTLVFDPVDSSILYGGGDAVYRSGDGGATWTIHSPFHRRIHTLAIDPTNPRRILAASSFGLHRSEDTGQTWISPPSLAQEVYTILFDGREIGRVYAGSFYDYEPGFYGYPYGGSLFVSRDSGASFSKVEYDFGSPVQAIVHDPARAGALYAGTSSHGVFRSLDYGAHWERPAPQHADIGQLISLVADPIRPDNIYVTTDRGVFRSTDGARNWEAFSAGLGKLRAGPLAISPDGRFLHVGTEGGGAFVLALSSEYPCVPADTRLCLVQNRYAVTLRGWWDYGDSPARSLGDRSGFFTIPAGSDRPDVVVKMFADGAFGVNGAPTFYSPLLPVPFVLTVEDTLTGQVQEYTGDPDASLCGRVDLAFVGVGTATSSRSAPSPSPSQTLTLIGGRFSIGLEALHPRSSRASHGVVVTSTDDWGIFSLPEFTGDATLAEVAVIIADTRNETGSFELSFTGLTSADYTLVVTDEVTGEVRTVESPGDFCGGVAALPAGN